jgi:ADP-ribose pyrophosphatase
MNGWEFTQRSSASGVVAVLAVTAQDEILLTEQYRPPVGRRVIDLPAGLVGDDTEASAESSRIAAARELEEEIGFAADSLRRLTSFPTSPGLTSEIVELFVADGLRASGAGGGVDGETIDVHGVAIQNVSQWLDERLLAGCLIDPKVYVALWWSQRPDLLEPE